MLGSKVSTDTFVRGLSSGENKMLSVAMPYHQLLESIVVL